MAWPWSPDGRNVYVSGDLASTVSVIDTASDRVAQTIEVGKAPHGLAIKSDGKLLLVVVDLVTRAVVRSVRLDKSPRGVEFGNDGKALYYTLGGVNAIQVLDSASDKVVAEISTGPSPHIAGYYRGTSVGVAVVQGPSELLLFNPATNAAVRSVAVGKQPHWVATGGDGKSAYVTNEGSNDVTVVDLATGKTTTLSVGNVPRKVVVQRTATSAGKGM